MKTVANLLRGPPGISDWSHAVISKSLLNAAGPAPAHLSSEIIVCLACCPTPEIKSQLYRTVLSLTVTMTETWSTHYWSADRSYLRSRFVLQHSSLIHSHRVECAIYVWDFQYNVYKMYICNLIALYLSLTEDTWAASIYLKISVMVQTYNVCLQNIMHNLSETSISENYVIIKET